MNRDIQRVRQELSGERRCGEGPGGGNQHCIGERARTRAERAIEEARETQHIVDALAIGRYGSAGSKRSRRFNFGIWIG
jgi:hypothetical protein